ncbi:MAG: hypothetical protein ACREER_12475, partial [Alphaproteobacteria bacterium]
RVLGARGYRVTLAEASTELGGRVGRECRLPGLAEWARVRDYRVQQINRMANVEVFRASRLDARQILEFGFEHVCLATGATWRRDGRGRSSYGAIEGFDRDGVIGVDAVLDDSAAMSGPIVVYDDDHFYMASVIAEKLRLAGHDVTIVTTAPQLAPESQRALDQGRIQARAIELGIGIIVSHRIEAFDGKGVVIANVYGGAPTTRPSATLVPVTSREPDAAIYGELALDAERLGSAGIRTLERIGDCRAPGLIAAATFAGHRYARALGSGDVEPLRDRVVIGRAA